MGSRVPMEFFDPRGDYCYCNRCMAARGDRELYQRGDPSRPYIMPVGWIRLGLVVPPGLVAKHDPFKKWHNSYHGTSFETMLKIFDAGLHLLLAGDRGMEGEKIGIGELTFGMLNSCC